MSTAPCLADPVPDGLSGLEARLARDMAWLNLPPKGWVPERSRGGAPVLDALIVGGGLCGLAAAAALRRLGIERLRIIDRAPAGLEGPWVTYARMLTLRTRKEVEGLALGLPALTFRAWFECQFGEEAWDRMDRIPRSQWMEYLLWYRRVLDLPVQNATEATAIRPQADGLVAVDTSRDGTAETLWARRVVLATGLDGLGAPTVPGVARDLDRRFYAHSADDIDMGALKGARVGVVGAGASAMDNAATVLEHGAARVDIFIRRADMPRVDKFTGVGSKGMVHGFVGLPDEDKWRFLLEGNRAQIPPPRSSTLRVSRHERAFFHLGSPITALREEERAVTAVTPRGSYQLDFLIFATGFGVDFASRPELASIAPHIKLWRDQYTPPPEDRSPELGAWPYLGPGFSFQEREAGTCPGLDRISCFAYPAVLSHGKLTSGIPAASDGATRLARGIARSLFVEDRTRHFDAFMAYDTPELLGDEWQDADDPAPDPIAEVARAAS